MYTRHLDSNHQYFQYPDTVNQSDSVILQDSEVDSRYSLSSPCSSLSQKSPRIGNSRRSSLVIPPRYSVCQGDFFRIRRHDVPLYPSNCYAVPETPAIRTSPSHNKDLPIQFIGIDVAEFSESDPSTRLLYKGEEPCVFESSKRCSSVIVMESEETQRNDQILSQLEESDEDSDEDVFCGRKSMGGSSVAIKKKYDSIPVSNLRNYLKREQELEEVNRRYREMSAKLAEQRERQKNAMEIEEEYERESSPSRPSIIPGQMDEIVEYNNNLNRRLSSCDNLQIMDSSYVAENIRSPRLSKVDSNTPNPKERAIPVNSDFLVNTTNFTAVMLQHIQERIERLPSVDSVQSVVDCASRIQQSSEYIDELNNYVQACWSNINCIDDYQDIYNKEERKCNALEVDLKLIQNPSLRCLEEIEDQLRNFISSYSLLLGWEAVYSDQHDILLKFPFHEGYFFLRISYSNGILLNVHMNHDTIKDELLNTMLYQLKTTHSLQNQYHCYEVYELLHNISNDLIRIKQAWLKQQS